MDIKTKLLAIIITVHISSYSQLVNIDKLQKELDKIHNNTFLNLIADLDITYEMLIQYLIEHRWDINLTDKHNNSLLHVTNNTDNITKLLTYNANLNIQNHERMTALHFAVLCKNLVKIQLLLDNGADISKEDVNGNTILHYALSTRCPIEIVTIVMDNSCTIINKPNNDGETPLHIAAKHYKDTTIFVVKKLIEKGALVDVKDNNEDTPLHTAVQYNNEKTLKLLLLYKTVNTCNLVNSDGNTPLHVATKYGFYASAQKLLKNGASPNIQNHNGNTPLHLATQIDIAKLLVTYNANRTIVNNNNEKPLEKQPMLFLIYANQEEQQRFSPYPLKINRSSLTRRQKNREKKVRYLLDRMNWLKKVNSLQRKRCQVR